jgi:hypothetical protein
VVLRGSLALEAWYSDRARRAHDLDLVVRDAAIAPDTAAAAIILRHVRGAVLAALSAAQVRVSEDEVSLDSIWTYKRAEGRRLSVPWTFRSGIREVVQVDLVFREPLQDAPVLTVVRDPSGAKTHRRPRPERSLWFASRAESLAWKLLWLETDMNPQAKDLYDAVLLAEDVLLPLDLVRRVYAGKGASWSHGPYPGFVHELHVEWESFAQQYPALAAGDRKAWAERLARALRIGA